MEGKSNPIRLLPRWLDDGAMAMAMTRGKLFTESNGGLGMVARMAMQVGGHSGMLTIGRYCLKPVQSGNRGIREVTFYEQCLHRGDGVEQLQPFLCDYHGVIVLGTNACEQHYLVLDDCTNDMARPCALDIKLGTRTTEPNASLKKQRKQLAKYPPQTELGCRLVGMRVWSRSQSQYLEFDKAWGFTVRDATGIRHGFIEFFGGHSELTNRRLLTREFIRRLRALLDWFEHQDQLEFISSSLLLVYNGTGEALLAPQAVQLKIIDFAHVLAHVRRGAFSDSGYIEGLRIVISLLEDISHARHMEFPIAKPAQAV